MVAELGPDHGPTVGLRVDMDALPVEERTGLSYASTRQGLMHACGHDLHTCTGLGVARLLAQEPHLGARVRLLFQPAEELAQGAVWMRDAGAVEGLDALYGVHVVPNLPVGTVGIRRGCLTAAAGELEILVQGEGIEVAMVLPSPSVGGCCLAGGSGDHGASADHRPPLGCVAAGGDQFRQGGGRPGRFNVIADQVRLLGTVRCLDLQQHAQLPAWIDETVQGICASGGVRLW